MQITLTGKAVARVAAALVGVAVLVIVGSLVLDVVNDDPFGDRVDPEAYQLVILSNDRLYVGHLRAASDEYFELLDAFFIRQTGEEREVVPLTEEFHGPHQRMLIRRSDVVVIEDLRSDSPVVSAIERLS